MSKKLLTGMLLGGAAAAGWHLLDAGKKAALKEKATTCLQDASDFATDYALEVLDIADGLVADYAAKFTDKVADFKDEMAGHPANLAKAMKTSDFEQETDAIRSELANAHEASEDDIVIDHTTPTKDDEDATPADEDEK